MTYQPPPVMPGPQPPNGDWMPTPPAERGRSTVPWLIAALAIAVLGMGGVIAWLASSKSDGPATTTAPAASAVQATRATTEPTPESVYTPYQPKPADFKLSPKITRKKCFGSAGCNVTFRVDVEYVGKFPLEDDWTWVVVYEINGIEDAPEVGSFELTGTRMIARDESVSTTSSKSEITLKVTSVEEG